MDMITVVKGFRIKVFANIQGMTSFHNNHDNNNDTNNK